MRAPRYAVAACALALVSFLGSALPAAGAEGDLMQRPWKRWRSSEVR